MKIAVLLGRLPFTSSDVEIGNSTVPQLTTAVVFVRVYWAFSVASMCDSLSRSLSVSLGLSLCFGFRISVFGFIP